jgi:hypothetical protein
MTSMHRVTMVYRGAQARHNYYSISYYVLELLVIYIKLFNLLSTKRVLLTEIYVITIQRIGYLFSRLQIGKNRGGR